MGGKQAQARLLVVQEVVLTGFLSQLVPMGRPGKAIKAAMVLPVLVVVVVVLGLPVRMV